MSEITKSSIKYTNTYQLSNFQTEKKDNAHFNYNHRQTMILNKALLEKFSKNFGHLSDKNFRRVSVIERDKDKIKEVDEFKQENVHKSNDYTLYSCEEKTFLVKFIKLISDGC